MKIEIIKTDNEIDWNISQLVVGGSQILQVSKQQTNAFGIKCFCAQDLIDGEYRNDWAKECFSKFTGKITIKND